MSSTQAEQRRQRIQRAESLLDRWLDLYEVLLERAHKALAESNAAPKPPDLTRLSDLANALTITRRGYEIELLARRVADGERGGFELDPNLLLGGIGGDDPDD